ncbi:MAG: AzlC family ABC transporter permease [Rhizobiaceae bacterium]|nr:AzlC family ABC transporter permease [Rhizobiaceae bacterium]
MFAVAFFGMLFGATGVNNGLTFWQTLGSSAAVFAGASQFVFLELYNQQVPVWLVLLTVFAVNFRHFLYSASVGRHLDQFNWVQKYFGFFFLSDPAFAASEQKAEQGKLTPAYYFGYASSLYPVWLIVTALGAYMGNLITDPNALGMDMLLSIYFLALLMGFRSRPNWLTVVLASAVVSAIVYKWLGAPWHITLGALAGIVLAAAIGKPTPSEYGGAADV